MQGDFELSGGGGSRNELRRPVVRLLGLLVVALTSLLAASQAHASDRIYWSNFDINKISYADLNGDGGGGNVNTTGATLAGPMGLTIDASRGRIYWANWDSDDDTTLDAGTTISWANLDGSGGGDVDIHGATIDGPHGLAIDPSQGPDGRLYWPNHHGNSIAYADLEVQPDGSISGTGADLQINNATLDGPRGVTVDPETGRLYWANYGGSYGTAISYVNLDESGDGDLLQVDSTGEGPEGTAVDPVSQRIYWSDYGSGDALGYANVDGTDVQLFDPGTASVNRVHGVAIDPFSRRLYWANYGGDSISSANLDGGDGEDLDTSGASMNGPELPVLLEDPVGAGAPEVSGGAETGATLSCSSGSWEPDVLESLLYRAPQSFHYQWSRDGQDLPGPQTGTIDASAPGSYACTVTAQNAAGSASQSSDAHEVSDPPTEPPTEPPSEPPSEPVALPSNDFSFGNLKRDRRAGTARLAVELPGPGRVTISGRGLRRATRVSALGGEVRLPIDPRGRAKHVLRRRGRVTERPSITFVPVGGRSHTVRKRVKLIEHTRGHADQR